jgi:AraC-like DNA-binding protein
VVSQFPFSIQNDVSAVPGRFRLILAQGPSPLVLAGAASPFPAGALLLVPPGSRCSAQGGGELSCVTFGRSMVDPLALDGSADRIVDILTAVHPTNAHLWGRDLEEARGLFAAMGREAAAQAVGYREMLRLKLMETILLLARVSSAPPRPATASAPLRFHADEVMQFIQAHAADELTLPGLASRYGLNPSYFSRLFSASAGMTLVEYINRSRIQKSCQLLKRTEASIVEVAMAVGYNNLSHFNRHFRRVMGKSPREYRSDSRK